MGEMITNPQANPMMLGGLNLIGLGGVGYFLMGQKKKAMITWAIVLLGGMCTFGFLYLFVLVAAYDAYVLAQRLAQGQTIRETENGLPFLDMLFR